MLMVWFERKLISDMQNRIGPNRAGPWGLFQTLADGIKLFFKEPLSPTGPTGVYRSRPTSRSSPRSLSFCHRAALAGHGVDVRARRPRFQLADPPIGILFLLAMSSVAVYGIMLAGWSSGLEVPAARIGAGQRPDGQLRGRARTHDRLGRARHRFAPTSDIVASQSGEGPVGFLPNWNLLRLGVVPFFLFIIAATAELNRPPFDLVEAEQELVGGFHTEYASIGFVLFFLAEFGNTITMSAIVVTLFLGGPGRARADRSRLGLGLRVVLPEGRSSSCSCTSGSGPRCRGCAMTSSWTWGGRS